MWFERRLNVTFELEFRESFLRWGVVRVDFEGLVVPHLCVALLLENAGNLSSLVRREIVIATLVKEFRVLPVGGGIVTHLCELPVLCLEIVLITLAQSVGAYYSVEIRRIILERRPSSAFVS